MKDKEKQITIKRDNLVDLLNQEQAELQKAMQIEEMAKDIPYLTLSREVFVSMTEMKKVGWTLSEEDNKVIAEVLVKNGWIKPNEDSVVLSREEYKMLLEEARKAKNQCIKIELETIMKAEQKARKETAEKIIDLIKTFCPDKKFIEIITHIIRDRFEIKE